MPKSGLFPGLFLRIERQSDGVDLRPAELGLVGTAPRRHSSPHASSGTTEEDDDDDDDVDEDEENDSLRRPFMVVFFKKQAKLRIRRTRAVRKHTAKSKYEGTRQSLVTIAINRAFLHPWFK